MVETRTLAVLLIVVGGVSAVAGGLGYLALTLDDQATQSGDGPESGLPDGISEIHDEGLTGENVTVGVLDVTGFERDNDLLAQRVVERRHFGEQQSGADGRTTHGTATAVTVARFAPDADLYLGSFETVDEYATAMQWLVDQGVDVVVTPVAYAGTFGDGRSKLARVTTNATDQGVTVVAPTGNLGQSHWLGEYSPTADGIHAFEGGTLNRITGPTGRAEFWLTTEGDTDDYRLELHELQSNNETELVASSVPHDAGSAASERLTVRLDQGRYALLVRGPATETDTRVRVASSTHSLSQVRAARSVTAPGAARGVISVGAVDPETDEVVPFSSRGPTLDGRLGVDVVARSAIAVPGVGRFTGTSASASVVGGVVTLLHDADPTLTPAGTRDLLRSTAAQIDGVNANSGHGRIDPRAAVDAATARAEESVGDRAHAVAQMQRLPTEKYVRTGVEQTEYGEYHGPLADDRADHSGQATGRLRRRVGG